MELEKIKSCLGFWGGIQREEESTLVEQVELVDEGKGNTVDPDQLIAVSVNLPNRKTTDQCPAQPL